MTAIDTRASEPGPETEPITSSPGGEPGSHAPKTETTVVVRSEAQVPPALAPWAPPPRGPLPLVAFLGARIPAAISLLAIWAIVFLTFLSGLQESRSQHLLYNQLRVLIAKQTADIGGNIDPGTPVALLEAPEIGLHEVVVEGTASGDLRDGPGHRRNTPLPGQSGTSVIYGRSLSYGAPFRRITDLHAGDILTASTGQGVFKYRVDEVRRAGDPLPDPVRTGTGRLTLATAEGTGWRAGWAPNEAVYVDATLQGATQPAPGGRLISVPPPELAMAIDWGAFWPLMVWMLVLVGAAIGATLAQATWGGAQTWLVGLPVLLFAAWEVADSAMQLLPNLM